MSQLGLRKSPPYDASIIDDDVGSTGKELIFQKRTVRTAHLSLEITQQVDGNIVLRPKFIERRHGVHVFAQPPVLPLSCLAVTFFNYRWEGLA